MTNFKTFKHRETGKYGNYPEHFEFNPDFILCEPNGCEGCKIESVAAEEESPETENTYEYLEEEGDLVYG